MADAEAIRFENEQTGGVGTEFDCDTKVGPLRLVDRMTITEWEPPAIMGVRHAGIVTGEGRFVLRAVGSAHTEFCWEESLVYPWRLGGPLGAAVGRPLLAAIWRRNLRRFKAYVERT